MKRQISLPRMEGRVSRQAHADLPEGTYEREMGREGFFGAATHIYHAHPPTGWTDWEGPLRPRAYDINNLDCGGPMPWTAKALLGNTHVKIRAWRCERAMGMLARNSDGADVLFVHAGKGDLYCDFGRLDYRDGDYIVLPRGTLWRLEPSETTDLLLVEATNSGFTLPDKGMLGDHAIFDPAVLDTPRIDDAFRAQQTDNEWRVVVKRRNELSTVTYPYNPLDAQGWKGDNVVVRVNWRDIRPIMSHRYHVPPSAHTTFVSDRFVICTFCPRPVESDPGALKVPFFHSNDDYDEVLFYHRGDFFSRDNIHPGMMTWHPAGFSHGPHPKAYRASLTKPKTNIDEVAVMIDTRDPLDPGPAMPTVEWDGYVKSWFDPDAYKDA
jgi:homogentisate 1,2-dioxygenase